MIVQLDSNGLRLISNLFEQEVLVEPNIGSLKKVDETIILGANHKYSASDISKAKNTKLLITGPGEYEANSVFVYALATRERISYLCQIDHMTVGLLWATSIDALSASFKEEFTATDILILDFHEADWWDQARSGKKNVANSIVEMINQFEPRVLIVVGAKATSLGAEVLKALGYKGKPEEGKYKLLKKDLPNDDMTIISLSA